MISGAVPLLLMPFQKSLDEVDSLVWFRSNVVKDAYLVLTQDSPTVASFPSYGR